MTHPATHPIAIIRRFKGDRNSDGIVTRTETAVQVSGLYAPGGSSEQTEGQDRTITQPAVYLPPDVDVTAVDAVIPQPLLDSNGDLVLGDDGLVMGTRFEVDGEPEAWGPGIVVQLKKVAG